MRGHRVTRSLALASLAPRPGLGSRPRCRYLAVAAFRDSPLARLTTRIQLIRYVHGMHVFGCRLRLDDMRMGQDDAKPRGPQWRSLGCQSIDQPEVYAIQVRSLPTMS